MEWQKGKCISLFSMDTYLEYCPPGATKAAGVDFICEYLDVPLKNTVAPVMKGTISRCCRRHTSELQ